MKREKPQKCPWRPTKRSFELRIIAHARTLSALVAGAIGALTDLCECPEYSWRGCRACLKRWEIEKVYATIPRFSLGMRAKKKARKK